MAGRRDPTEEERALWERVVRDARRLEREGGRAAPPAPGPEGPSGRASMAARPDESAAAGGDRPGPAASQRLRGLSIGAGAPPPRPAPTPPAEPEALAARPMVLARRAHRRLVQGRVEPDARIDLHGMTLATAEQALTRFLLQSHAAGRRIVLVITGKGSREVEEWPHPVRRGRLRHEVPHWLTRPPLSGVVADLRPAHRRHGGAGAFYVVLRRRR